MSEPLRTDVEKMLNRFQREDDFRQFIRPDGSLDPEYLKSDEAVPNDVFAGLVDTSSLEDVGERLRQQRQQERADKRQGRLADVNRAMEADELVTAAKARHEKALAQRAELEGIKTGAARTRDQATYSTCTPASYNEATATIALVDNELQGVEAEIQAAAGSLRDAESYAAGAWTQYCPRCGREARARKSAIPDRLTDAACGNCRIDYYIAPDGELYQSLWAH